MKIRHDSEAGYARSGHRSFRCAVWITAVAALLAPWMNAAPAQSTRTVDQLGWMAGCWEGDLEGGDFSMEEIWTEPRGGIMLGVSRIVQGEIAVEYEFLRIAEQDGDLVFQVSPGSQPSRTYRALAVGIDSVTFTSTEEQPKTLQFALEDGHLVSRFQSEHRGRPETLEQPLRRTRCPE